jgi:glycosyltransferase involved in cell wall biosynthesis
MNSTPLVSIIVPCYNEQKTIRLLLEAIYHQSYPREKLEVILADGMSTDATRAVVNRFQAEYPDLCVRIVDNQKRVIPSGLNRAIEASQGALLVRLDAHSEPAVDYVQRCVEAHTNGKGENVGGVWEIRAGGEGWIARSIAAAAAHPLGVGDALYRFTSEPGFVDTVPFGSFRRETLDEIGLFDETLLTNEDYELNARLRRLGGKIWLDPQIRSVYYARANLAALAKQYWRYGYWKWRMLRRYPKTLRWRQALPPLFVMGAVILAVASLWWGLARFLFGIVAGLYLLVLVAGSLPVAIQRRDPAFLAGMPLAIATMHFSWGSGFLWSVLRN